jgi:ATP-dependent RNA helicase RhlE
MPFSKFGLQAGILGAIQKSGYTRPTPVQTAAIPKVMQGSDLIAIAQTGTGKTAAFVLPILHRLSESSRQGQSRHIKSLILAPTRELAVQIMENIRNYGQSLPIRVAAIYGGVEEVAQIKSLRKGVDIVVATPGRLIDLLGRQKLDFSGLEVLVLDEADRMLHMGRLPAEAAADADVLRHPVQTGRVAGTPVSLSAETGPGRQALEPGGHRGPERL